MVVTNAYGSVTSQVATLTVMDPFILTQPASQAVYVGLTACFTVVAGGSAPIGYQWRKGGVELPGATASALTLTNAQLADAGSYNVTITNVYGSVASAPAVLTVFESCSLTINGTNYLPLTPPETLSVSFLLADGGVTTNAYSGFVELKVSGSGESLYTQLNDAFYVYTDESHNPITPINYSSFWELAVDSAPLISPTQPQYDARYVIIFDVVAHQQVAAPYLPVYRSDHIYDFVISAERLASGGLPGPIHFGVCDQVFSDNSGAYTVVVQQLTAVPQEPPTILAQSQGQSAEVQSTVCFVVRASGCPAPAYQWWFGGSVLGGGTDSILCLPSAQPDQSGA